MTTNPNSYFYWLCEQVFAHDQDHSYEKLMNRLFDTDFFWLIDMDENRAKDGLKLRDDFNGETPSKVGKDCSVLEMLIALAERMKFLQGFDTAFWFWEMMQNLGLDDQTDKNYDWHFIDRVLEDFMNRKISRYGENGLFPLSCPDRDQRKTEIWYQMQAYLNEKYEVV